jgi:phage I-like protein
MNKKKEKKRPTIAELEAILNSEEEKPIRILPNGEIVPADKNSTDVAKLRPLTMGENLGGEYAYC